MTDVVRVEFLGGPHDGMTFLVPYPPPPVWRVILRGHAGGGETEAGLSTDQIDCQLVRRGARRYQYRWPRIDSYTAKQNATEDPHA